MILGFKKKELFKLLKLQYRSAECILLLPQYEKTTFFRLFF